MKDIDTNLVTGLTIFDFVKMVHRDDVRIKYLENCVDIGKIEKIVIKGE